MTWYKWCLFHNIDVHTIRSYFPEHLMLWYLRLMAFSPHYVFAVQTVWHKLWICALSSSESRSWPWKGSCCAALSCVSVLLLTSCIAWLGIPSGGQQFFLEVYRCFLLHASSTCTVLPVLHISYVPQPLPLMSQQLCLLELELCPGTWHHAYHKEHSFWRISPLIRYFAAKKQTVIMSALDSAYWGVTKPGPTGLGPTLILSSIHVRSVIECSLPRSE